MLSLHRPACTLYEQAAINRLLQQLILAGHVLHNAVQDIVLRLMWFGAVYSCKVVPLPPPQTAGSVDSATRDRILAWRDMGIKLHGKQVCGRHPAWIGGSQPVSPHWLPHFKRLCVTRPAVGYRLLTSCRGGCITSIHMLQG